MDDPMDDRQIEEYLRSFRPLPPVPLPRRGRPWRLMAVGVAATLLMGVWLLPPWRRVPAAAALPRAGTIGTIGAANHLLANSPSWKKAIDDAGFAFRSSRANGTPLRRSALEFLSQEDLSK